MCVRGCPCQPPYKKKGVQVHSIIAGMYICAYTLSGAHERDEGASDSTCCRMARTCRRNYTPYMQCLAAGLLVLSAYIALTI